MPRRPTYLSNDTIDRFERVRLEDRMQRDLWSMEFGQQSDDDLDAMARFPIDSAAPSLTRSRPQQPAPLPVIVTPHSNAVPFPESRPAPLSASPSSTIEPEYEYTFEDGRQQPRPSLRPDESVGDIEISQGRDPERQQQAYRAARQAGLDDEGARVVVAVTETEGGTRGAPGDGGQSHGGLQFNEGGELPGFARWLGTTIEDARSKAQDIGLAVRYAAEGYLGHAIEAGRALGLTGSALATYAQQHGQRSEAPETTGANYERLFGGQPAAMPEAASQRPGLTSDQVTSMQGPAPGVVRAAGRFARNQGEVGNELGLPWARTVEICGPVAAAAFLRATGRFPGHEEAEAMRVAQERGHWQPGRGMGGTATEEQLLTDLGVATRRVEGSPNWQAVAADIQRGNPVIIDAGDHYMVAEDFDPQTGEFDFGETAGFLRAAKGRTKFRPEELPSLSGPGMTISPTAAIYLDNPETPAPSVVAGRAAQPTPSPAAAPSAPASALDTEREASRRQPWQASAGGNMLRQPLSQQPEGAGEQPYDPRDADQGAHEAAPPTYETVPPDSLPTTPGTTPGAPNQLQGVTFTSGGLPPADASWTNFGPEPERPNVQFVDGRTTPPPNDDRWIDFGPERERPAPPEPQTQEQSFPDGLTPIYNRAREIVGWLQSDGPQSGQTTPPARDDWRNDPTPPVPAYGPQDPWSAVNPLEPGSLRPSDLPNANRPLPPGRIDVPAPPAQITHRGISVPAEVFDQAVPRAAQTGPVATGPAYPERFSPAVQASTYAPAPSDDVGAEIERDAAPFEQFAPPQDVPTLPGEAGRTISEDVRRARRSPAQQLDPWAILNAVGALPFDVVTRIRQEAISDAEQGRMSGTDPLAPFRPIAEQYGVSLPSAETLNPEGRPAADIWIGLGVAGAMPDPMDPGFGLAFRGAGRALRAARRAGLPAATTAAGAVAGALAPAESWEERGTNTLAGGAAGLGAGLAARAVPGATRLVGRGLAAAGRGLGEEAGRRLLGMPTVPRMMESGGGMVPERLPPGAGASTTAFGADPRTTYELRHRVVDLDDLVASNTDAGTANRAFPQELQPRQRDRAGSQLQVDSIARDLNPDALLTDVHQIDRGAPIVGPDLVVESGNGRTMALRRAAAQYPERYDAYVADLRSRLPQYGLDESDMAGIRRPVLVRERLSDVDRAAFAAEANQASTLQLSPLERARQDATRLPDAVVGRITVQEGQNIDAALLAPQNRDLVRAYVGTLPATERAALLDADGNLNATGLERLKSALLVRTYPGDAGQRIGRAFIESTDPGVRVVEQAVYASLPAVARAEAQIAGGARDAGLSLSGDVAAAVDAYARLKRAGMFVRDYLAQGALFGERELTPTQERILGYLDDNARSPRRIRSLLEGYADAVDQQASPDQMGMFGEVSPATKDEVLDGVLRQLGAEPDDAADAAAHLGGTGTGGQELERAGARPATLPDAEPSGGASRSGNAGAGTPSLADEAARIDQARRDLAEVTARRDDLAGDPNADPVVLRSLDNEAQRLQATVNGEAEPAEAGTPPRRPRRPTAAGAPGEPEPLRPYRPTTPADELMPAAGGPEGTLRVQGEPEGTLRVQGEPEPARPRTPADELLPTGGPQGTLAVQGAPSRLTPANLPPVSPNAAPVGGPAGSLAVQGAPTPLRGANLPAVGPNAAPAGGPPGALAVQGQPPAPPSGPPPVGMRSGFNYHAVAQAQRQAQQQARRLAPNGQLPLAPLRWLGRFVDTVAYSSMLGPSTFAVNLFGNLLEPIYAAPKELVRGAARAIQTKNPAALREPLEMLFGAGRGFMQTGGALVDALAARGRYAPHPDYPMLSQQTVNPVGRFVSQILEAPNRVWSGVPDAFFGTIARSAGEGQRAAQLATDAVKRGDIKASDWKRTVNLLLGEVEQHRAGNLTLHPGLVDEIVSAGNKYADHQTFRDELGTVGKKVRTVARVGDLPVLGTLVTPFFGTQWNMGLRLAERTPGLGAVMNTQKGFDKAYDQVAGGLLFSGMLGYAASGAITGSGPSDPQKRREMEANGWSRKSMLVGDTYVPNRVFGIWAPLLDAVGETHDALAYGKAGDSARDVSEDLLSRYGKILLEQPQLGAGLADIVSMVGSRTPAEAAEKYLGRLAVRQTPFAATTRGAATAVDNRERTTDQGDDAGFLDGIEQRWRSGIGDRASMPARQDVLGREEPNRRPGLWVLLPEMGDRTRTDPVVKAFLESPDVTISRPREDITISRRGTDGKVTESVQVPMTSAEMRDWERIRGESLVTLLDQTVRSDVWKSAPEAARQAKLREKLEQANERATDQLRSRIGPAELRRRYDEKKGRPS